MQKYVFLAFSKRLFAYLIEPSDIIFSHLPNFNIVYGVFSRIIIIGLHSSIHIRKLHLPPKIHINSRPLHRCTSQILHRISELQILNVTFHPPSNVPETYPGVVDPSELGLRPFQHEESRQVSSVRSHDYHRESCPHHPEDSRRKTPRGSLTDSTVEEDAPCEPNGARQVQSVFFGAIRVGQLEATEGREAVQQIKNQSDDVDGYHDEDPQSVAERLQEGDERG